MATLASYVGNAGVVAILNLIWLTLSLLGANKAYERKESPGLYCLITFVLALIVLWGINLCVIIATTPLFS